MSPSLWDLNVFLGFMQIFVGAKITQKWRLFFNNEVYQALLGVMQASPQQCCCFSLCRVVLRVNPDPWCATSGPRTRVWHRAAESFSAPDAALFWVCGRVKQGKQAPWQPLPVSHLLAWALLSQLPNDIHTSAAQTQGGGVSAREHLPWRCQGGAGQAGVGLG